LASSASFVRAQIHTRCILMWLRIWNIPRMDVREEFLFSKGRSMRFGDLVRSIIPPWGNRPKESLTVLYASAQPSQHIFDALKSHSIPIRVFEAISAEGLIRGITPETDLVIFDGAQSVLASAECPAGSLMRTLADLMIPVVTQKDFLSRPEEMYGRALLARGHRIGLQHLGARFVLVTGFAGGVGKTTLAMCVARRFRESRRPAALLEAGLGLSTIGRRTAATASLYNIYTSQTAPAQWEGVDVFPATEEAAAVLASDQERERRDQFFTSLLQEYALAVVDAFPRHPLWPHLLRRATDVLLVATPAEEMVAQAEELLQEIRHAHPALRTHLVINKTRTAGERLGLSDSLHIPYSESRAQRFDPSLADPLLEALYPGWSRLSRTLSPRQHVLAAEKASA
jgi:hypothetical protein